MQSSEAAMATSHVQLLTWVERSRKLCKPDQVQWVSGTKAEQETFYQKLLDAGTLIRLNQTLRPGCYLARTDQRDLAQIDHRTYVCTNNQADAGPTNQWAQPKEMKVKLSKLFDGCMQGRTMYILPYCMGPIGCSWSKFGVMATDSLYTVVSFCLISRVGATVLREIGNDDKIMPTLHSVGMPLLFGQRDIPWPCSPDNVCVALFPDDPAPSIMSYGSAFGYLNSNASLRLASAFTKTEPKFLPARASVIGVQSPEGKKKYICLCLPPGTGQTGAAFETPTIPGWQQTCFGAETAWLNVGADGRLFAINPYYGFAGIATGNSDFTSRCVMDTIQSNTIFTNTAMTLDGDVWWEGMTKIPPAELIDWTGQKWTPDSQRFAAHPASRYTTAPTQCPILDSAWDNPSGVPIEAIVFGVRSKSTYPLVFEAFSWKGGVFWGSQLLVEERVAFGTTIEKHYDPFATRDSGISINSYITNWINIREQLGYSSPKMFVVNWFLQDKDSQKFLWPGFGENTRVFKWIFNRVDGTADTKRTPIGYVPTFRSFDSVGLGLSVAEMSKLFDVDRAGFVARLPGIKSYFKTLGPDIHPVLFETLSRLKKTLALEENSPPTVNQALVKWVEAMQAKCQPDKVHWCTGSEAEYDEMCSLLVRQGTFIQLNPQTRPNSYLARSDPRDVARVESRTFICTPDKENAGPTNNWCDPEEMKTKLEKLFTGCMRGRTMYVIPFCMGPLGSPYSRYGVEVTDSPYVVTNMRIMTRIGNKVLTYLGLGPFLPCLHSVGRPLEPGQQDVPWPCDPENTVIAHFPDDPSVMSFGSGYGGNALLGKKCYSLRIASTMGRKEGWLAEHMLILGLTSPQGVKHYIVAAFPSACGKTNLAMLVPTLPGWTVRCVGDDIAWLHVAADGTMRAINPENGFFGVAPGTSEHSNSSAMRTVKRNTIFTNVALTPSGDVWWEGMTKNPPPELIDWTGKPWTPGCGRVAAHPNSRYTVAASQCPVIDPDWENPNGVPISAIIFGGRRNSLVPLVLEAFSWQHGVFLGSVISSEITAASEGAQGQVRRDPFAMLPFCGYNMADYWDHWVHFRNFLGYNSPKIFYVNWFRKKNGKFIWPGFGENSRVLKWICGRLGRNPTSKSIRTPIGHVPTSDALDVSGLDLSDDDLISLGEVDCAEWLAECKLIRSFYDSFNSRVPKLLQQELTDLEERLQHGTENPPPTNNQKLIEWVESVRKLTKPARVHWCTGTQEEYDELCRLLQKQGTFIPLNPKHKPNCYLARSDPRDVARVESKTIVCCANKDDAGPNNNWEDPKLAKPRVEGLFDGCMKGRTMYVVPFCMGPIGSAHSRFGVEISDSPYVVVSMRIMTRIGIKVLNILDENKFFLPCLHSVGCPLEPGQKDVPWPCDPDRTVIAHFPDEPSVMSFGSGYGGNALLGKKCYALRIASVLGRKEGWLAEHMLILSLTSPTGNKYYIAAAFPSACGKTNLAMLVPTLPGWTVRCVGDDIAWFHVGEDGRLYAINPENGFFGVAPGTSAQSNSSAMETFNRNSIFTNVALTPDGDVWWEGMTKNPPPHLTDWKGQPWTPESKTPAAHPNSRYTCLASQSPVIDSEWENADGVPICAILFGGRREKLIPLVTEAYIWEQGVFMGSIVSSEQTAAAEGTLGVIRRDPFAMLPFCGYNMGDYFNHWVEFRKKLGFLSPKVFYVNWFQRENKKFLWPGFGENCRVLKWITERVDGVGKARATPIGFVPTHDGLDIDGLDIDQETLHKLLSVDTKLWSAEIESIKEFYSKFGNRLPASMANCLADLETRLQAASAAPTGNKKLIKWVEEMEALCQPANVHWCTGSPEEYNELCDSMIKNGSMHRLNQSLRPNSYLVRTDPEDARRHDVGTYMCTPTKEEAGPFNNWADPAEMRAKMNGLLAGSMKGRTMYVIAFCMGPLGSPYSRFGLQVTDSPYVALNMMVQTRVGTPVLNILKDTAYFLPCVHSVGAPLSEGEKDTPWPHNAKNKYFVHFADSQKHEYQVMSYGSAFGSNAILSRISYGMRIASIMGRSQGWLAERCAILGITSPEGKRIYVAAAIPKGCGKTSLAMMVSQIPGWTIRCVGDDIAWLHMAEDGRLWAINPESGFYDVATGTSDKSNRSGMATLTQNTIFTNVALTADGDVWWEGLTSTPPEGLTDWKGEPWKAGGSEPAAHPNSRYTAPASQCPVLDPQWDNPNGVPIDAFIFGGKRKYTFPLVAEAATWEQGVFLASIVGVENGETLAPVQPRENYSGTTREPFAVTPFLGYNINDYLQHWIDFRAQMGYNIPKIFVVNWFRENVQGGLLWPGFAENSRILKWIHGRVTGTPGDVIKTPIGLVPTVSSLDLRGSQANPDEVEESLTVPRHQWVQEFSEVETFYQKLGPAIPPELLSQLKLATQSISTPASPRNSS